MSANQNMCCCSCGTKIGAVSATYQLDQHELICHATGLARLVSLDAAIACSTRCLATYLDELDHKRKASDD